MLVGAGPVGRIATGPRLSPDLSALLSARTAVTQAESALRDAEAELAAAESTREVAESIADRLQSVADDARRDADVAARAFLAASHGDGATMSSMDAVFGAGNDLLAGLGGMARVEQIAGDATALGEFAEERTTEAEEAEERASAARDAVETVPVEDLELDVASAERAVTAATAAQSGLQARVAAASVELLESLPRDAGQLSEQGWAPPVAGHITDGYGARPNKPLPTVNEFHRGTDVSASCGTPVFAATGGVVIEARANGSYGNWVLIDHGAGVSTGYAHLEVNGILVARRPDGDGGPVDRRRRQHRCLDRMPPPLRGPSRRRRGRRGALHGGTRSSPRLTTGAPIWDPGRRARDIRCPKPEGGVGSEHDRRTHDRPAHRARRARHRAHREELADRGAAANAHEQPRPRGRRAP